MAVRHAALAVSAVLVLGLGVYLFIEVRGRPAVAQVEAPQPAAPRPQPARPSPAEREPTSPPAQVRKSPSERFSSRSRLSTSDSPPPAEAEAGSDPSVTGAQRLEAGGLRLRERNPQPHRFAEVMDEANKAYDRGDLDEAGAIATKVLREDPENVRMLRIAVSSACISGDATDAQKYYTKLPPADRAQMKTRCGRYGVTFTD